MYLGINMAQHNCIALTLLDDTTRYDAQESSRNNALLLSIDRFFRQHNISIDQVKGVGVVMGEGTFTSTRIATTVANTMTFAAQSPSIAISANEFDSGEWITRMPEKSDEYISATYSAPPSVT